MAGPAVFLNVYSFTEQRCLAGRAVHGGFYGNPPPEYAANAWAKLFPIAPVLMQED